MPEPTTRPRKSRALPPEEREKQLAQWREFVKGLREALGWTQGQLAEAVGAAGPSVISRWEADNAQAAIPGGAAKKQLIDLARRHSLLEE